MQHFGWLRYHTKSGHGKETPEQSAARPKRAGDAPRRGPLGTTMIDLHTHTLFSDGELVPAELARRAERLGYRWLAITDHVDSSTLEHAIRGAVAAAAEVSRYWKIRVLPGAELTHNPPAAALSRHLQE